MLSRRVCGRRGVRPATTVRKPASQSSADGNVACQYREAGGRIDQYAVTDLRKDSCLQSTSAKDCSVIGRGKRELRRIAAAPL